MKQLHTTGVLLAAAALCFGACPSRNENSCIPGAAACPCTASRLCESGFVCVDIGGGQNICDIPDSGAPPPPMGQGGAGGTGGTGNSPPTTTGGQGGTGTGPAIVKVCNDTNTPLEFDIGGKRVAANRYSCTPAVGQPCLSIPPGPTSVTATVEGRILNLGTLQIPAGQESLIVTTFDYPTKVVSPDPAVGCSATTPQQAVELFPAQWLLGLEPHREGDLMFAKPAGWQRATSAPEGTFRFQPVASIPLTEFTFSSQVLSSQQPAPPDLVKQLAASKGWTLSREWRDGNNYAGASAEDRSSTPPRFLEIAVRRLPVDAGTVVATATMASTTSAALALTQSPFLLKNVVATSFLADPLTPSEAQGTWLTAAALSRVDSYTTNGILQGTFFNGDGMSLNLGADGSYKLFELVYAECTDISSPCIIEGSLGYWETGRYLFDAGLVTLDRRTCISQQRDTRNVVLTTRVCNRDFTPAALFLGKLDSNRVRLTGAALTPISRGVSSPIASRAN